MAHTLKLKPTFLTAAAEAAQEKIIAAGAATKSIFVKMMESHSRRDQVVYLNNLTDVELATKFGIKRDQIISYVFRDKLF